MHLCSKDIALGSKSKTLDQISTSSWLNFNESSVGFIDVPTEEPIQQKMPFFSQYYDNLF